MSEGTPIKKNKNLRPLGAPGTPIYGGYVQEHEEARALVGTEKYRTYSDFLANVSIVAAGVRYFQNLVAAPAWRPVPIDESDEAKMYADKVNAAIDNMKTPMHSVVKRAAMMRFYGFSIQEIIAERAEDGTLTIRDIAPRAQRTIERWKRDDRTGEIQGIWQRNPQDGAQLYIPISKCLYLTDDSLNDSPEGLGLFRHLAEPVRRLRRYEQLEGWGYEGDLRGIPVGRAPLEDLQDLSEAEQVQALRALEKFMESHVRSSSLGLLLDSKTYETQDESSRASGQKKWDVELLSSSSNSQPEVLRSIDRINREIARILGVEHILLGDHSGGSYALSNDKSHMFNVVVDSTIKEIRSRFYDHVITFLFEINGWPMNMRPKMQADKLQTRRVEEITAAIKDLAQSGAVLSPDDPAINEVRDLLGLSPMPMREQELDARSYQPTKEEEELIKSGFLDLLEPLD